MNTKMSPTERADYVSRLNQIYALQRAEAATNRFQRLAGRS